MFKKVLGLVVLAAVVTGLVACSSGESEAGSTTGTSVGTNEKVKIGFIVKTLSDTWFQQETDFAKKKAEELGVELMVEEAGEGSKVMDIMSTMKTKGAQGVIICAPDVQLGMAIKAAADSNGLKLMSVDDRLVDADGKPMEDIPHLGISAAKIGNLVGDTIVAEMKVRGWNPAEVHGIATTKEELETAMLRINGAKEKLLEAGIPEGNIHYTAWKGQDITGALDAAQTVITQNPNVTKWVAFSSNDDGMMGVVRALEARGVKAENIIGVGINGTTAAQDWQQDRMTGVFASVLLKPRIHGAQTVEMMTEWIKSGKTPEMETYTDGTAINRSNYEEELKNEGMTLN